MPGWFSQPAPDPTPEPEETVQVQTEVLTEEEKRRAWRLLALMNAVRDKRPDGPITLDEIKLLGYVADGYHDLHDACAAIRNGCSLQHLSNIFT